MATGTSEAEAGAGRSRRLNPVMRTGGDRVKPLELFFDLVFVLALTQCTALMADDPTWGGLAKGVLLLGLLWWAWVGYTWFASTVDPEEGGIRILMFAAMAAFLVVGLCIPMAFDGLGTELAVAYGIARYLQVALLWTAGRDAPELRRSVLTGLAGSTSLAVILLVAGSLLDEGGQIALWTMALALDMAGPLFFGSGGWKLAPEHFAERHGLILIIALGESIVAIGVGAEFGVDAGAIAAAIVGIAVAAALWWLYFDVVALVAARRLEAATPGKEQNEMARDSYSYLHFPMVAGIVLVALAMKKTLGHVEDPLKLIPAFALLGGTASYLIAHVAFRWRNVHSVNRQRLALAIVLVALLPVVIELPALASVTIVAVLLAALIAYETHLYGESRERVRHGLYAPPAK